MRRRARRLAALAGSLAAGALACPGVALAHGGVPARVVANRSAGPYVVSVWAAADVGTAMIHVVYAPRGEALFVAPTAVRVGVAPASGRLTEAFYDARPDPVRRGARFVAHVALDRSEEWRVRVLADGPAGRGDVTARVRATPPGMLGPFGLALYAAPFVLVAGLRWRAAAARRAAAGPRVALASR